MSTTDWIVTIGLGWLGVSIVTAAAWAVAVPRIKQAPSPQRPSPTRKVAWAMRNPTVPVRIARTATVAAIAVGLLILYPAFAEAARLDAAPVYAMKRTVMVESHVAHGWRVRALQAGDAPRLE